MIFKMATNLFPLWSVLVAFVALLRPEAFLWYGKDTITFGLGIIMLGMGLTLSPYDFRRALRRPKAVALGVSLQFLIMPLLGWSIALLFDLPKGMAVGLILVSCCPGGTASNVVAFLARADLALSVSMTTVSTLAAVFMTPVLTSFYAGQLVPVDPWGLLLSILLVVVLPVSLGLAANNFLPDVSRKISAFSPFFSVLFIILIVGFIMAVKRDSILEHWQVLTGAVALLHLGGFCLGYFLARLLGFEEVVSRTSSIEVGMQNSGLGSALAVKHFGSLPLAPVPCALSAVTHCILGSIIAVFFRKKK